MSTYDQVLSDFMDAWNAGRRPRVREYLARLPDGPEREELADQLTDWLEVAPTPEYDADTRASIAREPVAARVLASGEAGLWPTVVPSLRKRAGMSVGQLAAKLVERLSLDGRDTDRAAGYLEALEGGSLDPTRVSRRLLDALGGLLGVPGHALADSAVFTRGLRPAAAPIFRAAAGAPADWLRDDIEVIGRAAMSPAPPPMDEIDRLFTGGPEA